MHKIWELAKRDLNISGGTIHQLAELVGLRHNLDFGKLILNEGDEIIYKNSTGQMISCHFVSYEGFKMNKDGNYWLACTLRPYGINEAMNMGNISVKSLVESWELIK